MEFLWRDLQEPFLYGESDTQPDYIPGWGDHLAHNQGKYKIGKVVRSVVEIDYCLVVWGRYVRNVSSPPDV